MSKYSKLLGNTTSTPQSEAVLGKNQVKNNAGGYVFEVSKMERLDRFLILGSDSPTYYSSAQKLTKENASSIVELVSKDDETGLAAVNRIVEISQSGRAPKNTSAVFALAIASTFGTPAVKTAAYSALSKVCRIGTDLFGYMEANKTLRGTKGGMGFRKAVANWYLGKDSSSLEYQMSKYQSRDGWSHADVLKLCHPKTDIKKVNKLFQWSLGKEDLSIIKKDGLDLIYGFEKAKKAETVKEIVSLIEEYGLVREHIPTKWLNESDVWEALLEKMPLTALIRNLGKMTSVGLIKPLSKAEKLVVQKLSDDEYLKKSRVHPFNVLVALKTYQQGHGEKGSNTWSPTPKVVSSLDDAFYACFKNVEPTGKNFFLGVDCSGSMSCSTSLTGISACMAATVMAMAIARTEKNSYIMGFTSRMVDLKINDKDSLDSGMKKARLANFGITDCAMPMVHALKEKLDVDCFAVLTDNETWVGNIHPFQALKNYRKEMNKNSKSVVAGFTASQFSIADPTDSGMLDIVGLDASVPQLVSNFVRDFNY